MRSEQHYTQWATTHLTVGWSQSTGSGHDIAGE